MVCVNISLNLYILDYIKRKDFVASEPLRLAFLGISWFIGPALGIGYLTVDASITATATAGGASQTLSQSAEYGTPTGNLGAYLHAWLAPRVLLRGDYRYIIVKPEDSEASIVDARAGLVFHPWPRVGIGLQYVYTKFRYDRGVLSSSLGGSLRYAGGQIVAGFAF